MERLAGKTTGQRKTRRDNGGGGEDKVIRVPDGEKWGLRKVLRRILYHELYHIRTIKALLLSQT